MRLVGEVLGWGWRECVVSENESLGQKKPATILASRKIESRHFLSLRCVNSEHAHSSLESAKPEKLEFMTPERT